MIFRTVCQCTSTAATQKTVDKSLFLSEFISPAQHNWLSKKLKHIILCKLLSTHPCKKWPKNLWTNCVIFTDFLNGCWDENTRVSCTLQPGLPTLTSCHAGWWMLGWEYKGILQQPGLPSLHFRQKGRKPYSYREVIIALVQLTIYFDWLLIRDTPRVGFLSGIFSPDRDDF